MEKVPLTLPGYQKLQIEVKKLKSEERPAIIQAISEAREHGDLSENAEYHAARERQSFVEGRINDLESYLGRVEIIDPKAFIGDDTVRFSATVTLADCSTDEEKTYQIVGSLESDIASGKLSSSSPLARAMMGKKAEDTFELEMPSGVKDYEIVAVWYEAL